MEASSSTAHKHHNAVIINPTLVEDPNDSSDTESEPDVAAGDGDDADGEEAVRYISLFLYTFFSFSPFLSFSVSLFLYVFLYLFLCHSNYLSLHIFFRLFIGTSSRSLRDGGSDLN